MRIYFIGSHSSGKSTLARYTSERYRLPLLTEVAQTILAEKELQVDTLRTDLNVVDAYQIDILQRQIQEEQKQPSFVSDRSLDCVAYAAQHSRVLSSLLDSLSFKQYIETLRKNDVVLFFVRPCKETLRNDGVRESIDWDGIVAIDAMVKFLLRMYDLHYFEINTSSMMERAHMIDSVLAIKNPNN